jgi:zinc protease
VLHHEQPLVDFRLLVGAGAAADPKDKLGLAHLEAALLDQGTTTRSAQELADAIDFIGGAMSTGAGTDLTFLHVVVMKDSFETGMRMLSDVARHPGFAPAEIDRQRQQMLSGLRVSLEDPEYVANSVFDRLVYGFPRPARQRPSPASPATIWSRFTIVISFPTARSWPSSATSPPTKRSIRRRRCLATGKNGTCRRSCSSRRPIRRGGSSSSTNPMRCRPKYVSVTSGFLENIRTTWP